MPLRQGCFYLGKTGDDLTRFGTDAERLDDAPGQQYLRVVGNLARLLRQDALRQSLLEAPDAATFIKLIDQAEG